MLPASFLSRLYCLDEVIEERTDDVKGFEQLALVEDMIAQPQYSV
jgi:hypothetical protein